MRLVDADELLLNNTWLWFDKNGNHTIAGDAIENAPTVDAVEVVRCKDCRYWDAFPTASATPYMHECSCRYPRRGTSANDFCSWGERREDEQQE